MKVTVNGDITELPDGTSVAELLASSGLSDKRVAVELNRVIIQRDAYGSAFLKDGDMLEILSFVGGG